MPYGGPGRHHHKPKPKPKPGPGGGGIIGGGGGPPPPPPAGGSLEKDRYASYLSIVESWGIDITSAIIQFAHHAASRHWGSGTFLYFARQTDWYKEHFKGIKPGMSEGEYNSLIKGYMQTARTINFFITRDQAQYALHRGIPMKLFVDKITAVQRIESQHGFFVNLEKTLRAQGIIKPGETVTKTKLYNFAMHRGPESWDRVLNESYARTAASEAGFIVGANISRKEVLRIASQVGLTPAI